MTTGRSGGGLVTFLALSLIGLGAGCATPRPPTIARAPGPCFDVGAVSVEFRPAARRALLELADSEALYTLVGGIKPISSGRTVTWRIAPTLDTGALRVLDTLRALAPALRCGRVEAVVQSYAATFRTGGDTVWRSSSLVVMDAQAVDGITARHQAFFTRLGVTASTPAQGVLSLVEHAPQADRWRGYGYLFGFPDPAVDFFVAAGLRGDSTGRVEPRAFRRIETWRKVAATRDAEPTLSTFVYAVAPDAEETPGDRLLAAQAARVYARYAAGRRALGRDAEAGIAALLVRVRRDDD